ncbi:MAG: hypothetical protein EB168_11720, partial [Euryarchaeota archaeon]|nr:hypothetical protein [Euryarchaeota archaeon]
MSDLDKSEVFRLLADDGTFATVAQIIAIKTFGDDALIADPLVLIADLEDEYGMEMSEKVAERLQAINLATTTDAFYEDVTAFRSIANTLIDGDPGFDGFDDLTITEMLWAVYEVELHHEETEFSNQVSQLIQLEIENDGEEMNDLDAAL